MDSVIGDLKCICGCYELFVLEKESQIYIIDDCFIYNSTMLGLLSLLHINSCIISDNNICLCSTCSKLFLFGNPSKFEIVNNFLCIDYQFYPPLLGDLFIAEETAIIHMYLVVSILK